MKNGIKNMFGFVLTTFCSIGFSYQLFWFTSERTKLGTSVFFLLLIAPIIGYLFYKYYLTMSQKIEFVYRFFNLLLSYMTLCMITIHVHFLNTGRIALFLFLSQISIVLITIAICYGLFSSERYIKWRDNSVGIYENKTSFKKPSGIGTFYEKPKNKTLRYCYDTFMLFLAILILALAPIGAAIVPMMIFITKQYLNIAISPHYIGVVFLSYFFLPLCIIALLPMLHYEIWWTKTKREIIKKYGSIEVDCPD